MNKGHRSNKSTVKNPDIQSIVVHTRDNNFQRAEVLKRNREKRTRYGEFLVEGVRSISAAVKFGWKFRALLYSDPNRLSDWGKGILSTAHAETHFIVREDLLKELSDKEETSEILAIIEMPADDLSRIPIKQGMVTVLFDRPGSPGNLGSSIRSCDALGVAGMVVTGHATDLYHPHTVRGSMGSLFALPCIRLPSHREVKDWVEKVSSEVGKVEIIGTSEDGAVDICDHNFDAATLLLMGNETFGLAANYREMCTKMLRIPMLGSASSLNVSCATSIFLYEILRQKLKTKMA